MYVNPEERWLDHCRDSERKLFDGGTGRDDPTVDPVVTLGIRGCVGAGV